MAQKSRLTHLKERVRKFVIVFHRLVRFNVRGREDAAAAAGNEARPDTAQPIRPEEKRSFFEFFLCLSRACLGKIIIFIYKWLKKTRF